MSTNRDELELLLPFHVNGTLTPEERAEVEAWLAQDDAARAEAEGLAAIRADMQAEDVTSPGEFGLARLMRDVGRDQAAGGGAPPQATRRPWLWQAVAAVAVAGFLGQTFWTQVMATRPGVPGGFQMAGAPAVVTPAPTPPAIPLAAAPAPADGLLTVAFAPDATEGAIRELLLLQGLEIVAGPSALGLYTLRAPDPEAARTALEAAAGLVESVEIDG